MPRSRLLRCMCAATALLAALPFGTASAENRLFHIAAQPAASGIAEFARQSGLQIIAAGDDVAGEQIAAITGDEDVRAALHAMLAPTNLRIASDDGRTVVLRSAKAETAAVERYEVIVITARRMLERAQDTPLPVSTLGREQLILGAHWRLDELSALTPNTNFLLQNGHQTNLSIRGLGTLSGNDGIEGSAGVFLDGVYLGRPGMAAMDLIDITQIEVLRGPQGTLYGKNTTAGAINISTALPSFEPQIEARASYGNDNARQIMASATGPIVDGLLAARLTAYATWREGWITNLYDGNKLNSLGRQGGRGQFLFQPSDRLTLRLIGEYAREQQSTGALPLLIDLGATPAVIKARLSATGGVIAAVPSGTKTAIDGPYETGTRQQAVSAEISWRLDGIALTSITAYRHWTYRSRTDADGSTAPAITTAVDLRDQQVTQELRAAFTLGAVDTVAGFYFFRQNMYYDGTAIYGPEAAAWLTAIPDALLPAYAAKSPTVAALLTYVGTRWDTVADSDTASYSVFGQSNWHLTPAWNVTLGARATFEYKDQTIWRPNPVDSRTGADNTTLAGQAVAPMRTTLSNAGPSFLVATDYRLSPRLMVYGLVSQGEKAGGINASLPIGEDGADSLKFKPETATNYEVGLKSELAGGRLNLNLNLFRTDVRDFQATYYAVINNTILTQATNVGKVRTEGVELEAAANLGESLALHLTAAFDKAYYLSYPNGPCAGDNTAACDLTGRPVAGAPQWNAGLNGVYRRRIVDGIAAYIAGEYSWRAPYYGNLDDSVHSKIGNDHLVNLRLGLKREDRLWDVSLWGKNVFNQPIINSYASYSSLLPGAYVAGMGDPATYGITLAATY
jgi:iron complex outermembrane recepter protein